MSILDLPTVPVPASAVSSARKAGASDFDVYRSRRYFPNLNGLRALCIGLVLWHHAPPVAMEHAQILGRGFMGVDFFFILSGFLITTLLLREEEDRGRISLKAFYLRRAVRILPVYLLVVTAVAGYYIVARGQTDYASIVAYYYLFLSNFLTYDIPTLSITWSLAVEEQFYLLWPLALIFLPSRTRAPLLIALILANVLASVWGNPSLPLAQGALVVALPNATYAPILMGSLLALALNRPSGHALCVQGLGHPAMAPALFAALLISFQLTPESVTGITNVTIHSLMTLCLAALIVRPRNALSPVFEAPLLARIGTISYGIYLYHLIALDLWGRLPLPDALGDGWGRLLGYSVLSILMAELSFRTIEAWARRFRPTREPPDVQAPRGRGS